MKYRYLVLLTVIIGGAAALFSATMGNLGRANAHHDVHFNAYYWTEWAYAPLTPVNAYDCIEQNNALQGAANEWNATGMVSIATQVNNCNTTANGIRWLAGNSGCYGTVALNTSDYKPNYLDPDTLQAGTFRALKVDVVIGTDCPDGDSMCAGWYTPCDVLTHEMGHGLGLADHYSDNCNGCGPNSTNFTYPVATIMDYPHRTDIQQHDRDDISSLYRRGPYSPSGLAASSENFHRINMGWTDRAHNEATFYVDQSYDGGAYVNVGTTPGTEPPALNLFGRDVTKPGKQYCFRVYGRTSWGVAGANSSVSCTTPPDSVGLISGSFPAGATNVALCWDAAPSAAGVTHYYVHRRRNLNGTIYVSTHLAWPNTSCFGKVLWNHTVSSTAQTYHFSVRGCDSWGCSDYRDMTNPSYQWVRLPWNGTGNSGTPDSLYHTH